MRLSSSQAETRLLQARASEVRFKRSFGAEVRKSGCLSRLHPLRHEPWGSCSGMDEGR